MGRSEKSSKESIISLSAGSICPSISPRAVNACISASVISPSPSISPSREVLSMDLVIRLVKGAKTLDKKSIIKAVLERNPIGSLDAIVFGVISPAINTSSVITIVDKADPAVSSPSRKLTNRIVEREAINIFTKLFATRIPPIVCSRSSLAFFILLFLFESES